MRVARLDLTRYGRFTDAQLEFGPRGPGRPDLHVVYGPNEAGKTTAFSALLDLVFGFGSKSGYAFLHPYSALRIGGVVELGSAPPREVVRLKRQRPQSSLFDGANKALDEGLFAGALGGLDRDSYRSMFSLDDETLERGGDAIIASKGDLGQLLFAASAGIVELGQSLEVLRSEADRFFRGRARTELSELKQQLDGMKSERDRLDTALPLYRKLVEAAEVSRSLYDRERTERSRLAARAGEIDRLLQALPHSGRLLSLREALASLIGLPQPPPGWAAALPDLQRQEVELATKLAGCGADRTRLLEDHDAVVVDEAVLLVADRIEDLAGEGRARHVTAEKDLPERRRSLDDLSTRLGSLLRRLDRAGEVDPERLILSASVAGRLRELIEQRSGVEVRHRAAERQHVEAVEALAEVQAALEAAGATGPGDPADLASVRAFVSVLRTEDHAGRRRIAERTRDALADSLHQQLLRLRPWAGTIESLTQAFIPSSADLARWQQAETEAVQASNRHGAEVERLTTERLRFRAERDVLDRQAGLAGDAEAATARAEREQAWAKHRRDLQDGSADLFEAALRRDDLVVAARFGRDQELARLRHLDQALALCEADLARASDLCAAASDRQARLRGEIGERLSTLGWPEEVALAPLALDAWLQRRAACLETAGRLHIEERAVGAARSDMDAARDRLLGALKAAGLAAESNATMADLMALAEEAITRDAEFSGLRARCADRRAAVAKRRKDLDQAEALDEVWKGAWAAACATCWLGEQGVPSVATAREVLATLADLGPLLEARAALALRIAKMEEDQVHFTCEVDILSRDVLGSAEDDAPLNRAAQLAERLRDARAGQARRAELQRRLDELEHRAGTLLEEAAVHRQRSEEMMRFFGVGDLKDVATRLQQVGRRADLERESRDIEQALVGGLQAATLDEAVERLSAADRSALENERDDLALRLDAFDERLRHLFAESKQASDAIHKVGGDDAAARLAEARHTLLLDTEDKALRYLRLKIGIAAAEQALRTYREKHRSSMMARASEAFRTVSRGAYSGLTAQPGEKGDVLVAVGQGDSKEASELSKGTRFQLYLALRVAGYYEFCQTREPVPFVADDIMETFDDFRAEEAFRLFGQMAEVGQVIYLTHHRHLCDIARSVCPDVRITELPTAASAAAF